MGYVCCGCGGICGLFIVWEFERHQECGMPLELVQSEEEVIRTTVKSELDR